METGDKDNGPVKAEFVGFAIAIDRGPVRLQLRAEDSTKPDGLWGLYRAPHFKAARGQTTEAGTVFPPKLVVRLLVKLLSYRWISIDPRLAHLDLRGIAGLVRGSVREDSNHAHKMRARLELLRGLYGPKVPPKVIIGGGLLVSVGDFKVRRNTDGNLQLSHRVASYAVWAEVAARLLGQDWVKEVDQRYWFDVLQVRPDSDFDGLFLAESAKPLVAVKPIPETLLALRLAANAGATLEEEPVAAADQIESEVVATSVSRATTQSPGAELLYHLLAMEELAEAENLPLGERESGTLDAARLVHDLLIYKLRSMGLEPWAPPTDPTVAEREQIQAMRAEAQAELERNRTGARSELEAYFAAELERIGRETQEAKEQIARDRKASEADLLATIDRDGEEVTRQREMLKADRETLERDRRQFTEFHSTELAKLEAAKAALEAERQAIDKKLAEVGRNALLGPSDPNSAPDRVDRVLKQLDQRSGKPAKSTK